MENTNFEIENNFPVKWTLIQKETEKSPCIKNHTCIFYNNSLIIFGGFNSKTNGNEIYSYSLTKKKFSIRNVKGDIPKPRNGHSATLIPNKEEMIIIGGWMNEEMKASDEIYSLKLNNLTWSKVLIHPHIGPVNMHTADYYKRNESIIIFNGGDGKDFHNDIIEIDIFNKKSKIFNIKGKMPSPRANHASSIIGDNLIIFGGYNGNILFNDLYCIDLKKLISTEIKQPNKINESNWPCSRAGMRMTSCFDENFLVLFGGFKGKGNYLNDLYFYNTSSNTWIKKPTTRHSPCKRAGCSMTIGKDDRQIYIYGGSGNNGIYTSDLYRLDIDELGEDLLSFTNDDLSEYELNFGKHSVKNEFIFYIKSLYNKEKLSDCELIIENKRIKTHKFILSLFSHKFKTMFKFEDEFSPGLQSMGTSFELDNSQIDNSKLLSSPNIIQTISNKKVYEIKTYSYCHFQIYIKYLYFIYDSFSKGNFVNDPKNISNLERTSFEFSLPSFIKGDIDSEESERPFGITDLFSLIKIADDFMTPSLKNICEKQLIDFVYVDTYNMIESLSNKYNCTYLSQYLKYFYKKNKDKIPNEEYSYSLTSEISKYGFENDNSSK